MDIFYFFRRHFIISILSLIFLIGGLGYAYFFFGSSKEKKEDFVVLKDVSHKEEVTPTLSVVINKYSIDIKGEVNSPGVYVLEEGRRVIDAISIAGGLTKNADVSITNLSRRLFDEMVIFIYSKTQVKNFNVVKSNQEVIQKECVVHIENITNNSCVENRDTDSDNDNEETPSNGKISLNTATEVDLMTLPGIGESKAKTIIEYRDANGGFKSIDELKNVSGIGEATFEKLKDYIML